MIEQMEQIVLNTSKESKNPRLTHEAKELGRSWYYFDLFESYELEATDFGQDNYCPWCANFQRWLFPHSRNN